MLDLALQWIRLAEWRDDLRSVLEGGDCRQLSNSLSLFVLPSPVM